MSEDLLSRLRAARSDEERNWLVTETLLNSFPLDLQAATWAAAVPHWFDAEILAALLERPALDCVRLYNNLQNLPFVEPFEDRGGHNIHEVTRAAMLDHLWRERHKDYVNFSARAANYFARRDEPLWQIERIYNTLITDPDSGANLLKDWGRTWYNSFAYDLVYALAEAALEHASAGRLDERGKGYANFWRGEIDRVHYRYAEAMRKLEIARQASSSDGWLKATCTQAIGNVHYMLDEYAEALACYEEARPIYAAIGYRQGEANCIHVIGDIHYALAKYTEARARYQKACLIYAEIGDRLGEANCIKALGDVHKQLAEYTESRARYQEARSIYAEIGDHLGKANCDFGLGEVAVEEKNWQEAEGFLHTAMDIYRETGIPLNVGLALRQLGAVAEGKGNRIEATRLYQEALRVFETIGVKEVELIRTDLRRVQGETSE